MYRTDIVKLFLYIYKDLEALLLVSPIISEIWLLDGIKNQKKIHTSG